MTDVRLIQKHRLFRKLAREILELEDLWGEDFFSQTGSIETRLFFHGRTVRLKEIRNGLRRQLYLLASPASSPASYLRPLRIARLLTASPSSRNG